MEKPLKKHRTKLDQVYINQLEHFTPEDLAIIKPYMDAAPRDWELHAPEDVYYSKKSLAAQAKAQELWYSNPNATESDWSEFPAVLGYNNVPGMAEYYVYKRKGKFYTVASNKFEYNKWFALGDDFEVISKMHEFTDLNRAIKFAISDAKKLSRENMLMTGHISAGESQPQLTESELISPYEADEIFEKFGVKNAMLLSKEDLKKAFRTLAIKHHPDKGGNAEDMKQINAAYESLKINDGSGESGGTARKPTRQDRQDSSAYGVLKSIIPILEKKLTPSTLPIKEPIQVQLSDTGFLGAWLKIIFNLTSNQVTFFDIVKRGNKIRTGYPDPNNDYDTKIKEFNLNDINGLVSYIESTIKSLVPTQIK